jgi:hypothetical protein
MMSEVSVHGHLAPHGTVLSGHVMRQDIMAEVMDEKSSSLHGSQEAEGAQEKGQTFHYPLQGHTAMTRFLPQGPIP